MSRGTAIVTGAASERGIGRAVARRLSDAGWSLGLLDRDAGGLRDLTHHFADEGREAHGWGVDVTDEAAIDAALTSAERLLPPITALVNVAGIGDPTPFLELDRARWERVITIDLTSVFLVTRRVVAGMADRGFGRVVCLGSTAAQTGGGNYSTTAYAAAKAGIEGLVRGAAREMAPYGITVNCVAPAIIDTDIMGGPIVGERLPGFVSNLPVGRLGTTDEVAALIEFLVGDDAGYITGATYNINGGLRIG